MKPWERYAKKSGPWDKYKKRGAKVVEPPEQDGGERSVLSDIAEAEARSLGIGVRGAVQGVFALPLMISDALTAVVNLSNRGINKVAKSNLPEFRLASSAFNDLLDYLGVPKPENTYERIAEGVNRGAAAGLSMPSAALSSTASSVAPNISKALAQEPMLQGISGVTSELSSAAAKESGLGPGWQLAAGVAGGVAPTAAKAVWSMRPNAENSAALKLDANKTPADSALSSDVIFENRSASSALEAEITGLRLNEGARSGDPGILALQRASQDKHAQTLARANEVDNQAAIEAYIRERISGGGRKSVVSKAVEALKKDIDANRQAAVLNAEKVLDSVDSGHPIDVIGGGIRSAVLENKTKDSARMSKLWNAIDQSEIIDSSPLHSKINEIFGSFEEYFSRVSSIPGRALARAKDGLTPSDDVLLYAADGSKISVGNDPKNITVGQLAEFNKQITRDARLATASGDYELSKNLYKMKEGIEETIAAGSSYEGSKLGAFWKQYSDEFVPKYRQGVTKSVIERKPTGEFSVTDTDVGGKFFAPGKKGIDGAKAFKRTFGDSPEAMLLIREYASEDLLRFMRSKGDKSMLSDKIFKMWKTSRSDALKSFGLDDDFDDLGKALQNVGSAIEREAIFNKSILSKLIDKDPSEIAKTIMQSSSKAKAMKEVMAKIGNNNEAAAGLKAAIGDWFEANISTFRQTIKDGHDVFSGAKVQNFLKEYGNVLSKVYDKKEMAAFRNVLSALKKMSLENYAAKPVGSPTYELTFNAMELATHYAPFGVKLRFLKAFSKSASAPFRKAVDEIILRAMYSPDEAQRLYLLAQELKKTNNIVSASAVIKNFVVRQSLLQSGMNVYRREGNE